MSPVSARAKFDHSRWSTLCGNGVEVFQPTLFQRGKLPDNLGESFARTFHGRSEMLPASAPLGGDPLGLTTRLRALSMPILQERSSRQPFLRAPGVVVWLIVVLVLIHAVRVFAFQESGDSWLINYGLVPARYSGSYLAAHAINPGSLLDRALPFVTYMFLHGSFTHVLINSVWLLAFGPIVTRRFGTPLFLVFFLLCGLAGAAVHLALNWGSDAPVVGASAAISGLMAAGFRMLPNDSPNGRPALTPLLSSRVILWTALWVAVNVVAGLTGLGTGGGVQIVAWQAHLGGYAAGLLLSGPFDHFAARSSGKRATPA